MAIKAIFFDVGGTLVDETRMFDSWADWLGVDRMEFHAAVGATVALKQSHRQVFDMVAPGTDIAEARRARHAAGRGYVIEPGDLYPDASACLAACRAAGLVVGIAGNQPAEAEAALHACGLDTDHLAVSANWGVSKPDPRFFTMVADACGFPPHEIAYVGDRVDNDVIPARAAGMWPVFLARGPWGVIQSGWDEADQAAATIRGLDRLPDCLRSLGEAEPACDP